MKSSYIKSLAVATVMSCLNTGCVEETFPNTSYMTEDQIDTSDPNVVKGFANAIVTQLAKCSTYTSSSYFDIGYPGVGMVRDIYCADFPIYSDAYDYFYYFDTCKYLGEYATSDFFWDYYYSLVMQCNNMLRLEYNENSAPYFALAHFYRAWFYFDMARMFEYKNTGFDDKDALAASRSLHGLTVPIVTEATTEAEATNMPRAKYAEIYSFVLSDLYEAAKMLGDNYEPAEKYSPSSACVFALLAKVYLEIAAHMEQYPEDIASLEAYSNYEAKTVKELYKTALSYADKAIEYSTCRPLTQDEWYGGAGYTSGFNSMASQSWMLGFSINKELLTSSWLGWMPYINIENYYGLSGVMKDNDTYTNSYKAQRCISSDLYSRIPDSDWRKKTWISPDDAGKADAVTKYPTKVTGDYFAQLPAYAGFKFRTNGGEMSDYSVGSAVDYPMMRIEEIYFVRMEALAGAQSVAAAVNALTDFMNTYRYKDSSYQTNATSREAFINEMMRQKRVEFWGEGIVAFDYKRLNLRVLRYYNNTNYVSSHAFNSKAGYCAPWLNWYILRSEVGKNTALVMNPDPSLDISQELRD